MAEYSDTWMQQARAFLQYQRTLGVREVWLAPVETKRSDAESLARVREELGECMRCRLHQTRRNLVFGEGNPEARLMFVGEGPGADEDRQGRPFVGRAGSLLTRMIQAMTLERSDVYIANVVKCRPPGNREPERIEIDTCLPFLERQIAAVAPEVIVGLGKVATSTLLETRGPIGRLRGKFRHWKGIPVMPTYHPSFLLRNGDDKRWKAEAWSDLKQVMAALDIAVPDSGSKP